MNNYHWLIYREAELRQMFRQSRTEIYPLKLSQRAYKLCCKCDHEIWSQVTLAESRELGKKVFSE